MLRRKTAIGIHHGHLARYREIVAILVRHGFGFLVDQLGLGGLVPFHRGILGHARKATPYTQAEHLRLAFEELGATFIKLGQILSTRSDLLPPEFIHELSKLQDAVPPEPPSVIETEIERELGRPVSAIFARFDPEPLGSASIGQVHAARLPTGKEVVVKVQRPSVEELVEEDIAVLSMHEGLARMLDPEFNMAEELAPYARRLAIEAYSPRRLAERVVPLLLDVERLAVVLPRRLERLSAQAERGNLSLNVRIAGGEHYLSDVNRMVNRLILAMLTTGFVVGLAVLMLFYHPPGWEAYVGWLFAFGFVVAALVGAWVMLTVLRGKYH